MMPFICKNDGAAILKQLEDYVQNFGSIKGLRIMEQTNDQICFLIDTEPISERDAQVWWNGYMFNMAGFAPPST